MSQLTDEDIARIESDMNRVDSSDDAMVSVYGRDFIFTHAPAMIKEIRRQRDVIKDQQEQMGSMLRMIGELSEGWQSSMREPTHSTSQKIVK